MSYSDDEIKVDDVDEEEETEDEDLDIPLDDLDLEDDDLVSEFAGLDGSEY